MDNLKLHYTTTERGLDSETFIRQTGESDGAMIERAATWLKEYLDGTGYNLDHAHPPELEWIAP